jgi:predicted Kef-type K+ transport protein
MALAMKPVSFRALLVKAGEKPQLSLEIGVRLGQISEFSLLIAVLAQKSGFISERASFVIQLATLITFVVSSYVIVMRYPTPIAVSDRLRRD